jgi:dTMP kinase
LHKTLCHGLKPDLSILMLSDLSHSLHRARRRNLEQAKQSAEDENRFEKESRAFHKRVLAAYMAIAEREPERMVKIDAREPVAAVHKKIAGVVAERLLPAAEEKHARQAKK